MPEIRDFTIDRTTDHILRFALISPPDPNLGTIADWDMEFQLRLSRGANTVLTVAGSLSAEVARAAELGIFDVPLTANQTTLLTARTYYYAFVRTNTGFRDVLAKGVMTVETY